MTIHTLAVSALACSLMLGGNAAFAADKVQTQDQVRDQTQLQDQIYGSQLMTEQERIQHRNMMRSFKTNEEREAYRMEHHNKMQVRAKEKGVQLPDEPSPQGSMRGSGGGMGQGGGGRMGTGGRQ